MAESKTPRFRHSPQTGKKQELINGRWHNVEDDASSNPQDSPTYGNEQDQRSRNDPAGDFVDGVSGFKNQRVENLLVDIYDDYDTVTGIESPEEGFINLHCVDGSMVSVYETDTPGAFMFNVLDKDRKIIQEGSGGSADLEDVVKKHANQVFRKEANAANVDTPLYLSPMMGGMGYGAGRDGRGGRIEQSIVRATTLDPISRMFSNWIRYLFPR